MSSKNIPQRGYAVVSLLLVMTLLSSSGGFGSVKQMEEIKSPDLPKGIEEQFVIEEKSIKGNAAAGTKVKTTVRQKMSMPLAVFQTTEAKKRSQLYAKTPAFHVGEKTTMSLTWFGIKAGEITLEVRDNVAVGGRDAYHFVGTAKSSATMDLIHSVDDSIESYVDKETFYPLKSELHGVETDRLRETRMLFDYSRQNIHYWMKRVHVKKGTKEEKRVDPITPGTLDIFTSGFFLRAQQLEVGNVYHSSLYNEGKHIIVKAKVLRREILETEIGRFQMVVVQPVPRVAGIA